MTAVLGLSRLRRVLRHDLVRLVGGSAFAYALRISGAACSFATQLLLARWIGAEALGTYVFAAATMTVFAFVVSLGLPFAAMRSIPQALALERPAYARGFYVYARRVLALSGALGAVFLAVAGLLLAPAEHAAALALAALGVPFMVQTILQDAVARGVQLQVLAHLPSQLGRPALLLGAVLALYASGISVTPELMVGVLVAVAMSVALSQYVALRRPVWGRIGWQAPKFEPRAWLGLSLPLLVVVGYMSYLLEINLLVAGFALPADELAVFGIAFQITNLVAFFLQAVNLQFGPRAAALFATGDRRALQRLISRATQIRFAFAVVMMAAAVFGGPYLLALFGPRFAEGAGVLIVLAAGQFVTAAAGPTTQILSFTGHQNAAAVASAVALGVNVVLVAVLAPLFGMMGAAYAVLAAIVVWNAWLVAIVLREVKLQPAIVTLPGRK